MSKPGSGVQLKILDGGVNCRRERDVRTCFDMNQEPLSEDALAELLTEHLPTCDFCNVLWTVLECVEEVEIST